MSLNILYSNSVDRDIIFLKYREQKYFSIDTIHMLYMYLMNIEMEVQKRWNPFEFG